MSPDILLHPRQAAQPLQGVPLQQRGQELHLGVDSVSGDRCMLGAHLHLAQRRGQLDGAGEDLGRQLPGVILGEQRVPGQHLQ